MADNTEQPAAVNDTPTQPPPPPAPITLEIMDCKDLEIKNLKVQAASDREAAIRMQLGVASQARMESAEELAKFEDYIKNKYKIDFRTHQVNISNGMVVPRR